MADAPLPLVPPDVDLRDFAFMPLDVVRLRDSELAATSTGEEFRAAVLLWCASWHQIPAGSLPDDDAQLSVLAGYGRVVKEWLLHKNGALHGWVKCSDGRIYHPTVAEKANESWFEKLRHRWRRECDRIRKDNKARKERGDAEIGFPPEPIWNSNGKIEFSSGNQNNSNGNINKADGIPAENALKGQGQGQGQLRDTASSSFHSEEAVVAAATDEKKIKEEIERRCEQAAGFGPLSGISKIAKLVADGADMEARVLPVIRAMSSALRDKGRKAENWVYFVEAIKDPDRRAKPSAVAIAASAGVFVPQDTPAWAAWDDYGKRTRGKGYPVTTCDGKTGWYFPSEFPPADERAA